MREHGRQHTARSRGQGEHIHLKSPSSTLSPVRTQYAGPFLEEEDSVRMQLRVQDFPFSSKRPAERDLVSFC